MKVEQAKLTMTPGVNTIDLRLVPNQKLEAAIKRVLSRGGKGSVDATRYDKQHHRHNKS